MTDGLFPFFAWFGLFQLQISSADPAAVRELGMDEIRIAGEGGSFDVVAPGSGSRPR